MEKQADYIKDISDIRSMMEKTTKFLSLSGWAGIMAGIYAFIGAYLAYEFLEFNPDNIIYATFSGSLNSLVFLGTAILVLAIVTAVYFSKRRAVKRNERLWNATSRRLLMNMCVPLVTGGVLILIFISKGILGLIIPMTLIFYGLSLFVAGRYTYEDVKGLGLIQIFLGLISLYFIEYSLLFWAFGFGAAHIVYGIYIHLKYEK